MSLTSEQSKYIYNNFRVALRRIGFASVPARHVVNRLIAEYLSDWPTDNASMFSERFIASYLKTVSPLGYRRPGVYEDWID